jgi:hypothetical protein
VIDALQRAVHQDLADDVAFARVINERDEAFKLLERMCSIPETLVGGDFVSAWTAVRADFSVLKSKGNIQDA